MDQGVQLEEGLMRGAVGGLRACLYLSLPSWVVIIIQFKYFHAVLLYFVDLLISVVNFMG